MFHAQQDITVSNITNAGEVCDSSITFGFSFYYRFPRNAVIPQCYVICGSESGIVSQDDLSQNGFSYEGNVKMGGWFHGVYYGKHKRYLYVMKNLQEI